MLLVVQGSLWSKAPCGPRLLVVEGSYRTPIGTPIGTSTTAAASGSRKLAYIPCRGSYREVIESNINQDVFSIF